MLVTIDNTDINFNAAGKKDDTAEAVVLLHGWGANIELFADMMGKMSVKYYCIAPDMPGFGNTPEPPGVWTVDDYADFVVKFIASQGLKKVILLGHSFGGRVIIKLCNRTGLPFEISRVIFVDAAGIRPEKTQKQQNKEKLMKVGKKLLAFSPKLSDSVRSMLGSADYRAASPLMREILVNVVNEDLTPLLPGIKQEVLLIWGELDTATPISDAEKMESLIPNAGLARMPGVGHYSFLENPVQFNAIISSYLGL